MKVIPILFALLSPLVSVAANQTVILGGYNDLPLLFHENGKRAHDVSRALGRQVVVAAGMGNWNFDSKTEKMPLRSAEQLRNAIRKAVSGLGPGDTLAIYFTDHGGVPKDENDPKSSRLILDAHDILKLLGFGKEVSFSELQTIIQNEVPARNQVKLIVSSCFSGGVHEIAMALPNVCSASMTDYASLGFVGKIDQYSEGFWNELVTNRQNRNLYAAHRSAVLNDTLNDKRGLLSSDAYVDKVLNEGSYKAENRHIPSMIRRLLPFTPQAKSSPRFGNYDKWFKDPECEISPIGPMNALDPLVSDVQSILPFVSLEPKIDTSGLPPVIIAEYRGAISRWKVKKEKFFELAKDYQTGSENLRSLWLKGNYDDEKYREELKKLRANAEENLSELVEIDMIFRRASLIKHFFKVADKKQKSEFLRLLACETSPL